MITPTPEDMIDPVTRTLAEKTRRLSALKREQNQLLSTSAGDPKAQERLARIDVELEQVVSEGQSLSDAITRFISRFESGDPNFSDAIADVAEIVRNAEKVHVQ
jgi:hypothetical protein